MLGTTWTQQSTDPLRFGATINGYACSIERYVTNDRRTRYFVGKIDGGVVTTPTSSKYAAQETVERIAKFRFAIESGAMKPDSM